MMQMKPISALEAADMLGVHVNTVKRIPREQLPFFRIGRRGDRRYLASDVRAYIAARMESDYRAASQRGER